MQANIALGLLEVSSIARGVEAADAMCKAAGVELFRAVAMPRGKYMIVVTGPVGEVESSLRAGADIASDTVLARYIIRNVHKDVYAAFEKKLPHGKVEALGIVETKDAVPAVYAADAACKAAKVDMIELRLGMAIGGKGYFSICGEVGAVRTAIAAGVNAIGEGALVSRIVIPQTHEHVAGAI